ncbi:unnamed protein product [Symbiodinium sp. CCMP2456]|nr:unnamed protein product [Symbiodinium sp. CCMP2456]
MQAVDELLTIVMVTSPVPSNPSTEMLEHVLSSCTTAGGFNTCPTIVVSDGYRVASAGQRPKPKAGRVAPDWEEPYEEFRHKLDNVDSTASSALSGVQHIRVLEHKGFAGCLHIALRQVRTPFVLVLQHDRPCLRPFDGAGLLAAMLGCSQLKYVGLPTKASLARTEPAHLASNWHLQPEVWDAADGSFKLRPLCLWYDSAHICRLDHYRDFVFRKGRDWSGGFPEDSFGQDMQQELRSAAAEGRWKEVHDTFGTYLYDDGGGPVVGHLNGRRFRLDEPGTSLRRKFATTSEVK